MAAVEVLPGASAGTRLGGRFRLDDRVDEAYGTSLWKATDKLLRRRMAIHVLPDGPVPEDLIVAVNAAARVSDPRLARVFDADYGAGPLHHFGVGARRAPGGPADGGTARPGPGGRHHRRRG